MIFNLPDIFFSLSCVVNAMPTPPLGCFQDAGLRSHIDFTTRHTNTVVILDVDSADKVGWDYDFFGLSVWVA